MNSDKLKAKRLKTAVGLKMKHLIWVITGDSENTHNYLKKIRGCSLFRSGKWKDTMNNGTVIQCHIFLLAREFFCFPETVVFFSAFYLTVLQVIQI